MKHLLTLLAAARSPAHVAVFREFAAGLERVLRRPAPFARIRRVLP
jgi:hypothetical protein